MGLLTTAATVGSTADSVGTIVAAQAENEAISAAQIAAAAQKEANTDAINDV